MHQVFRREPNSVVEVARDRWCSPDQQRCQVVDLLYYLAARGDAANYFERAFCESEKMAIPVKGVRKTAAAHGLELPGGRGMSPSDITGQGDAAFRRPVMACEFEMTNDVRGPVMTGATDRNCLLPWVLLGGHVAIVSMR